jgi:hypothetical protein
MSHSSRVFSVAVACAIAVSVTYPKAAPVDTNPAPQATLDVLRQDFGMAEVVSLLSASATRSSSKAHLEARATRFKFIATQSQGPMVVDAYTVLDMKSNIIGYRLFYGGEIGPLLIADAVVNRTEKDAVSAAAKLVAAALDSVSTPDGSKMYFLGIQNLDSSRVLKIMVRAGAQSPMGIDYAIHYVVSRR